MNVTWSKDRLTMVKETKIDIHNTILFIDHLRNNKQNIYKHFIKLKQDRSFRAYTFYNYLQEHFIFNARTTQDKEKIVKEALLYISPSMDMYKQLVKEVKEQCVIDKLHIANSNI
tara:strand:+ start:21745 stop:22089 length:345 start_codon:yes stop_codon:yes gene_type:complete